MGSRWRWKNGEITIERAEALANTFERELYEGAIAGDPENLEVLIALGDIYTRHGFLEKGLEVDKKLVAMRPNESIFHYNLACSHSLLGHIDTAFESLREAVKLGYDDSEHLERDRDLDNLKGDRRYGELLRSMQKARAQ
jgi:tetratricopeptide (TPR) repeat protein